MTSEEEKYEKELEELEFKAGGFQFSLTLQDSSSLKDLWHQIIGLG